MHGYVLEGDCLDFLRQLAAEGVTVQSVVCDPPYGLSFMGRYWDNKDNIAFQPEVWRLCFDLLPPGGHLVAFGGTRTYHRLVCAVENAGFEIRDQLAWVYGTGFPKSMDISKTIVKTTGDERETQQWAGWGTALKPAWEPIVLARKPVVGTVASNVLEHRTGAINVDGCRIAPGENGRFPANLAHDGSDEVMEIFDSFGERGGGDRRGECRGRRPGGFGDVGHDKGDSEPNAPVYADSGSAARFFYCAKASKKERADSKHPTMKPLALMQWLVRLVTPPGGMVLDPFAGSGTTGEAAQLEGFQYILIEREPEYARDIEHRLSKYATVQT